MHSAEPAGGVVRVCCPQCLIRMLLCNIQGEYVDAPMLDNHYKGSRFSEKVDELINGITFVSDSITSETHNPVAQNSTSTNGRSRTGTSPELSTDEPLTVSTDDSRVLSMSVAMSGVNDSIRPASQANQKANRTLLHLYVPIMSAWKSFISMSIIMQFVRMKIILVRSFFVLFKRYKMVLGTTVLHVLMACTFCIIIGETGPDIAVVTPVAAFGGLLLILSGVQYVFWLFANNKVSRLFSSRIQSHLSIIFHRCFLMSTTAVCTPHFIIGWCPTYLYLC